MKSFSNNVPGPKYLFISTFTEQTQISEIRFLLFVVAVVLERALMQVKQQILHNLEASCNS